MVDVLAGSLVDPCDMFKFRAEGWESIDVLGLVGMLGLALSLWLFTVEIGEGIMLVWLCRHVVVPMALGFYTVLRYV